MYDPTDDIRRARIGKRDEPLTNGWDHIRKKSTTHLPPIQSKKVATPTKNIREGDNKILKKLQYKEFSKERLCEDCIDNDCKRRDKCVNHCFFFQPSVDAINPLRTSAQRYPPEETKLKKSKKTGIFDRMRNKIRGSLFKNE